MSHYLRELERLTTDTRRYLDTLEQAIGEKEMRSVHRAVEQNICHEDAKMISETSRMLHCISLTLHATAHERARATTTVLAEAAIFLADQWDKLTPPRG